MKKFEEKRIRTLKIIKGRAVSFKIDQVQLPNKKLAVREYLDHPGAVAVIPVVKKNHILMVKQYRYPVGQVTYEIPAGKLEKGENISTCAKRELEEETGYRSKSLKKILSIWPTAAFANEIIHIFIAEKLTVGNAHPDEDEFVDAEVWPIPKLLKAISSGKIKDSKTIIAVLAYCQFYR